MTEEELNDQIDLLCDLIIDSYVDSLKKENNGE